MWKITVMRIAGISSGMKVNFLMPSSPIIVNCMMYKIAKTWLNTFE